MQCCFDDSGGGELTFEAKISHTSDVHAVKELIIQKNVVLICSDIEILSNTAYTSTLKWF